MGGSALKVAPQINLDEFERRLRAAGSPSSVAEDPLDELARLVGIGIATPVSAERSVGVAPRVEPPQPIQIRLPHIDEQIEEPAEETHCDMEAEETVENAPLRGSFDHHAEAEVAAPHSDHSYTPRPLYPQGLAPPPGAIASSRRSGRVKLMMSLLVGVGAVGLVSAWAIKGAPGLPRTPPVIMAVDGPTKVQPPSQDTVASPSDSASLMMKDQAAKPGPVKLVSSEEQPVDLQQQTKPQQVATRSLAPVAAISVATSPAAAAPAPVTPPPAPATPAAVTPAAATPVAANTTAPAVAIPAVATTPVVAAPSPSGPAVALTTVGPTNAPPTAPAAFPEPKRVKTVSVRPDGSVISSGSAAVADAGATAAAAPTADVNADAMPQPTHPPVPRARPSFESSANTAAQPATPKLDLPPKPSAKSTARVPIAKIDTTVAADNQSQEAPAPTPLQIVPSLLEKAVKSVSGQSSQQPTQVAAADPVATATTPSAGAGSYTVQLAAPGTQQEAQSMSARLQAKYASELGGMQPSIHQADLNGRQIYRVRVGALSKAEAVALCEKLKASGGACFVAKN
jgi:hypothetical protein